MLCSIQTDQYFLRLVHPSRTSHSRELPFTLARAITCISSQVRTTEFIHLVIESPCSFTGLGLAAILGCVKSVTDSMVEASSLGLADSLTSEERAQGLLYPRIERSMS